MSVTWITYKSCHCTKNYENVSLCSFTAASTPVGVFKKKKIIKPFITKYTTTPLPPKIEEEGALNRTEDDPRCKILPSLFCCYMHSL